MWKAKCVPNPACSGECRLSWSLGRVIWSGNRSGNRVSAPQARSHAPHESQRVPALTTSSTTAPPPPTASHAPTPLATLRPYNETPSTFSHQIVWGYTAMKLNPNIYVARSHNEAESKHTDASPRSGPKIDCPVWQASLVRLVCLSVRWRRTRQHCWSTTSRSSSTR